MSVTVTSSPFQVSVDDAGTSVTVSTMIASGTGLPAGGSSGFYLRKSSGSDYDVEWQAIINGTAAALSTGIAVNNVPKFTSGVADDDFLRVSGTTVAGRSAAELLSDIGAAASSHAHAAGDITSGTLAVARGGTGVTSLPMISIATAADAAAARTVLGVTNVGSYTGQIETAADKTYTIDPGAATARTITGLFIKCGSGTVTATLKNGSDTVKAASVSTSSGDQSSLANTTVSANGVISIVLSSNSSATDVIFAVEYTE